MSRAVRLPALEWADNIWRGLRDFSRPYIEVGTSWSAVWVALAITVRGASTSIAPATRVIWQTSCRLESAQKHRMRMAVPRTIDRQGGTALGAITVSRKCSTGTSSCDRLWTGFTSCTNSSLWVCPYLHRAASLWACSRTTAFCRIKSTHRGSPDPSSTTADAEIVAEDSSRQDVGHCSLWMMKSW